MMATAAYTYATQGSINHAGRISLIIGAEAL